jgi:outer membrane receptor protein involved in Fe transport
VPRIIVTGWAVNVFGLAYGLRLGFGIKNLTDRDPPIIVGSAAANTDPQQFDVLGRRYFLHLNYRF